jgi:GrpB-like predicted nucleotidyltransferase (UPF0157 family)
MARSIDVVTHDPAWPAAFAMEAARIADVFGSRLRQMHHVGSTAVPGLHAKPIIDILVVLDDTDTIDVFNPAMEALGYRVRGECLEAIVPGTPGRFYFSKNAGGVRTHQVHVCAEGHPEIAAKLAFRNYLRAHSEAAATYGRLKHELAAAHRFDNISYMRGKDAFVKSTLEDAMHRWSENPGPPELR